MGFVGVAGPWCLLVLWLLLEHGTSDVVGICEPVDTNYTANILVNRTETYPELKSMDHQTETCFIFSWFCKTKTRKVEYYALVNRTVLKREPVIECCPGYSRDNSSEPCGLSGCLNGTYGDNCTEECSCPLNAYRNCDKESGNCTCMPGWQGTNCTEACDSGYYGTNCQSQCKCKNNATCDPETGKCDCKPGWEGHFCESACSNNSYGDACNSTCQCNSSNNTVCNHVTGGCDICKPGWQQPNCSLVCEPGTYGQDCMYNCTSCERAHAERQVCHPITGECVCSNGYSGSDCQSACTLGMWGFDCNNTCSENCTTGFCDNVNGTCHTCFGKQGDNCSKDCDAGTFGFDCQSPCQCNSVNSNGTCDPCSGACHCVSRWTGYDCSTHCPASMTDEQCQNMDFGDNCEPWNNTWSCRDGWTGRYCTDVCPDGHYGENCSAECACNTTTHHCNPVTGNCTCRAEATTKDCASVCQDGTYGANCSMNCTCNVWQICDSATGNCTCKPGWTGDQCNTTCETGKYGLMCSLNCTCGKSHNDCHPVNGSCDCKAGWDGSHCKSVQADESRQDNAFFRDSTHVYIVAASGAFLAFVLLISVIVCLKRRKVGTRDKHPLSANNHEVEIPVKEGDLVDTETDSEQKQSPCLEKTHRSIAMQQDNVIRKTESGADTEEDDDSKRKDAVIEINDTVPAEEPIVDEDVDTEEHYVDVENESTASPKTLRREIVDMDGQQNNDDDTYDVCVSNDSIKAVPTPDDSYDKFENFKTLQGDQDEDYDVIAKGEPKRMISREDYSTFESVRQESMKECRKSEDDKKRESECYEKLGYMEEKDQGLKFDTSLYNMGNEMPITKDNVSLKRDHVSKKSLSNSTKIIDLKSDKAITVAEKEDENRLSETLYEDCLDEAVTGLQEASGANTSIDQEEIYEQVSDNSDDEHLDSVHSKADMDTEIYENLSPESEDTEAALELDNVQQSNANCQSDKKIVLKSKERKAVDYETFELNFK